MSQLPRTRSTYGASRSRSSIARRFSFSASHIIGDLPPGHPCARLHGHNYEIEIVLQAPSLDAAGFVRDFNELAGAGEFIRATFDHKHLNDVLAMMKDEPNGDAREP